MGTLEEQATRFPRVLPRSKFFASSMLAIWRVRYRCTLPRYLGGSGVAALAHLMAVAQRTQHARELVSWAVSF